MYKFKEVQNDIRILLLPLLLMRASTSMFVNLPIKKNTVSNNIGIQISVSVYLVIQELSTWNHTFVEILFFYNIWTFWMCSCTSICFCHNLGQTFCVSVFSCNISLEIVNFNQPNEQNIKFLFVVFHVMYKVPNGFKV